MSTVNSVGTQRLRGRGGKQTAARWVMGLGLPGCGLTGRGVTLKANGISALLPVTCTADMASRLASWKEALSLLQAARAQNQAHSLEAPSDLRGHTPCSLHFPCNEGDRTKPTSWAPALPVIWLQPASPNAFFPHWCACPFSAPHTSLPASSVSCLQKPSCFPAERSSS